MKRLAEDCCKYGSEYQSFGFALARASLDFGTSHSLMEKERESLLRALGDQVVNCNVPYTHLILNNSTGDCRSTNHREYLNFFCTSNHNN